MRGRTVLPRPGAGPLWQNGPMSRTSKHFRFASGSPRADLRASTKSLADQPYTTTVPGYYEGTLLDYRVAWVRKRTLALHFGYWDEDTRSHAQSLINMNKVMASLADLRAGQRVLDAGCGIGGPAMWLAENYGVEVVGVTLSAVQARRANKYARQRGLEGLARFEQQDFTNTSFPDESFDIVWAEESVCHVPLATKQAFMREAYRVLKPGGQLILEDWVRLRRPFPEKDERLLTLWLSGWAIYDLATMDEYAQWAEEAGFTVIGRRDITSHAHRSFLHLYRISLFCYPAGLLMRALRIRSALEHGNMRSARLQWVTYKRGLWGIGILSARK